jgi:hypothetical protein
VDIQLNQSEFRCVITNNTNSLRFLLAPVTVARDKIAQRRQASHLFYGHSLLFREARGGSIAHHRRLSRRSIHSVAASAVLDLLVANEYCNF